MDQLPWWVPILQALATPAIACFAAVVGWGQWRASKQKIAQDLFDRRFQVFSDVRKTANEVLLENGPSDLLLILDIRARAQFLFAADLNNELKKMADSIAPPPVASSESRAEVFNSYLRLIPIFESYMRLDQRPPYRTPWQWLRHRVARRRASAEYRKLNGRKGI